MKSIDREVMQVLKSAVAESQAKQDANLALHRRTFMMSVFKLYASQLRPGYQGPYGADFVSFLKDKDL